MASVSGTSSLGNTALRGFGGMATGIDRDSIIEQMTLGTTNKITKRENEVTELEWKQEAYRSIADKILDLQDNYFSWAGNTSLKSGALFSSSVITALGDSDSTRFVHASGSSDMVDYISILGVQQLASSATQQSKAWINGIHADVTSLDQEMTVSNLRGAQLRFGIWNEKDQAFDQSKVLEFADTYTDDAGKTHEINYKAQTPEEKKELADQLNEMLKDSSIKLGDSAISDMIRFEYDADADTMKIVDIDGKFAGSGFSIQSNSTALKGLGYSGEADLGKNGISLDEYNGNLGKLSDSAINTTTLSAYMTGKKVTFNYNGSSKEIELFTSKDTDIDTWAKNLQDRLDAAFGKGNVTVQADSTGISFSTASSSSNVSITSDDQDLLEGLGLEKGDSNKINVNASLDKANLGMDDLSKYLRDDGNGGQELDLTINGVEIHGLSKDSTVQEIIDKINATEDAGVKATYVDTTGQFVLIASETGKGREIDLGQSGSLAKDLFGNLNEEGEEIGFTEGRDAKITVSYGGNVEVTLERSSNTFDLEGMSVTVSGTFGYDENGKLDSSKAVSFSAEADVDGAVEAVKKFFEDYNALATEVYSQLTTRHDSNYGPLTDDQKDEMSEESIKNWEEKAKQGLLNNDTILQDLNTGLGNIFLQLLENSMSSQELEEMGISYSQDTSGGGTLEFNETAFRQAMENNPEKVAKIFSGSSGSKGLVEIMEDTLTPYATRYASKNGGSYGRLIEEAGSEKVPLSAMDNYIYKQLQDLQDEITELRERLTTEQDRYISQFTAMETAISQMNSQSSWLSSLQG